MLRLTWKWLLPGLLLALALPMKASGAEFSAKMVLKQRGQVMPGRIYVKDGKMRQEFLDEEGHTVTIVRKDKRQVWVIMPFEKKYLEIPLGIHLPGQFLQIPPEAVSKRRVCSEEMCGFQVDRIEVIMPGGSRQTYWVATKLGLPIKTVCTARQYSVEYMDIRERQLEDRLFEVPLDCQKVARPLNLP
jgi:hypothetical protein